MPAPYANGTSNGLRRVSSNTAHRGPLSPSGKFGRKRPRSAGALVVIAAVASTAVAVGLFASVSVLDAHRMQTAPLSAGLRGFTGADGSSNAVAPGIRVEKEEEEWTHPLIHIVNTRFMQEQAHLTHLAEARLVLFEKFCLPSIIRQSVYGFTSFDPDPDSSMSSAATNRADGTSFSDPPFLWIIKVDPALEGTTILTKLIDLVRHHREVMLVGSNTNYGIGVKGGGWRGGQAGADILQAAREGRLYSGDVDLVRRSYAVRSDRVVMETRLDADDGLNLLYLESLQRDALEGLFSGYEEEEESSGGVDFSSAMEIPPGTARWLYWCPLNHVAWDPTPPDEDPKTSPNATMYGTFIPWRSPRACITAGLTVASSVGVLEDDIPRFPHQSIVDRIRHPNATVWSSSNGNRRYKVTDHPSPNATADADAGNCGLYNRTDCLRMITHPKMGALRSRTPTSAGMRGVVTQEGNKPEAHIFMTEKIIKDPKIRTKMWKVLGHYFAVTEEMATDANTYVREHFVAIVGDNLRGQCTKGHSCKISSKEELQRLLDLAVATEGKVGAVSMPS